MAEVDGAERAHIEATDKPWIRSMHSYAFRSGQWARILSVAPDPEGRDCYVVQFPEDDKADFWVVDDPAAEYEFAEVRGG